MKVVITMPVGERFGGAENILWSFLRHVDRARVEPVLVFLQDGRFPREVAALGLRTAVVPAGRLRHAVRMARAVGRLTAILTRERPALVLDWMAKSHLYGAPAAALAGMTDRLLWWQQVVTDGDPLNRAATLLPALAVGCYSREAAAAQERLRPRRETFVVHPGIADPTRPAAAARERLRRELGVAPDAVVLGTLGRLQPGKGAHRVVRAVAELLRLGHAVHGLVVGGDAYGLDPEYARAVRRLPSELGIERAVTFAGQVADPLPYLAASDVLVSASDMESFGLTLVEAMALAVPVVAVDAGGPREIIDRSGVSGILVPSPSVDDLVGALEPLAADAAVRRSLGEGGRRRYLAAFTAERMADAMASALEAVHG